MKKMGYVLLVLTMASLTACASTPTKAEFRNLSFGMTKSGVESLMGEPQGVRAKDHGSATIEIWEYEATDRKKKHNEPYWVVFQDGKVTQWGRPASFGKNEPEPVEK